MGTRWLILWLAALLLAAVACDSRAVESPAFTLFPTATATVAPTPTATPSPAPATPTPAATPAPADTPTLEPTSTPTPTPEPAATPTPTPLPDGPLVHIGNTVYLVDLAVTSEERAQGLSDRPSLNADVGMLFVYDEDGPRAFWMPRMNFPLDMVWIRADCTVAGITADVPHPDPATPLNDLPRYPSNEPVRFVLEINAGQAALNNITPGSPVTFGGQIAGKWGC